MNSKQRKTLITGGLLILLLVITWLIQGAAVFTKDKVLVDSTTDLDRMLGIENKVYVDQFILGFFPSGFSPLTGIVSVATAAAIIAIASGIIIYSFRRKREGIS